MPLNPTPIIYDLETYKHLFVANLFVINSDPINQRHSFVLHPRQSLPEQLEIINKLLSITNDANALFVGFNSISFDDCILRDLRDAKQEYELLPEKRRAEINTSHFTTRLHETADLVINSDNSQRAKHLKRSRSLPVSLDLYTLLNPLPSLKKVEIRTRQPNVQDLPYAPEHPDPFTDEQIDEIVQYCWNDVNATAALYQSHGKTAHALRQSLQDKFGIKAPTLESLSEPQVAEQTMLHLYTEETGDNHYQLREAAKDTIYHYLRKKEPIALSEIVPDMIEFEESTLVEMLERLKSCHVPVLDSGHPSTAILKNTVTIGETSYQMGGGGLHSVDTPAIITPTSPTAKIIDVDVASYYPAILINQKLHPRHLNDSFSELYKGIRDERLAIKRADSSDPNAHALKIVINSLFGKTASVYSPFYDPAITLSITVTGQLALLMLIEMFNMQSITVLSANTDGVTVMLENYDMAAFQEICEIWQEETGFELEETHYAKIARRDVNNYCALTTDGAVKRKGIFTRPSLKHDVKASVVQQMAENHLLFDKPIHPDELPEPPTIYDYLYHFSATKDFDVHLDDMSGAAPATYTWTTQLKSGKTGSRTTKTNKAPKNVHPDHPEPQITPPVPPKSSTPLQKSNRWYISTDPTRERHVIRKTGGKNGNTITVPNSDRARLLNQVSLDTHEDLPADLDTQYYIDEAQRLVDSIKGA